jgi:toxin ParE1/3/4
MARLVVSDRADLDFSAIVEMLRDKAGADVAARYRQNIDDVFERLAMFPKSGMPRPKMGRDVRIAVVSPYIVFYEYRRDVIILRILDGRRNITSRLVRG